MKLLKQRVRRRAGANEQYQQGKLNTSQYYNGASCVQRFRAKDEVEVAGLESRARPDRTFVVVRREWNAPTTQTRHDLTE